MTALLYFNRNFCLPSARHHLTTRLSIIFAAFFLSATATAQNINLSTLTPSQGIKFTGTAPNSHNGQLVDNVGDFNGDGFDDFVIGSPLEDQELTNNAGRAYVVFGNSTGLTDVDLSKFETDNSNGITIDGIDSTFVLGYSVSGAGDYNGDGISDLVIGSWSGKAYVVFGKMSGLTNIDVSSFDTSNGDGFWIQYADEGNSGIGFVSGAGDINGDSLGDLIIGYPGPEVYSAGVVTVIFGKTTGITNLDLENFATSDENGFRILGESSQGLGLILDNIGDFNGDGIDDIVVGGRYEAIYGTMLDDNLEEIACFLIFGKYSGFQDINLNTSTPPANITRINIVGVDNSAGPGYPNRNISTAGDFNGDGFSDIMIGARASDLNGDNSGSVYLIYGRGEFAEKIDLAQVSAETGEGLRIDGITNQGLGYMVNQAGDINNDGYGDLLLSANDNSIGIAYVVFGKTDLNANMNLVNQFQTGVDGFQIIAEDDLGNYVGLSVAGDINADDYADMILQTADFSASDSKFGTTYLVFGGPAQSASIANWHLW